MATDPRVFFAAERTLLAWLRTAIAMIGMGFLVARFGYYLAMLHGSEPISGRGLSSILGIAMVLFGTGVVFAAAWQHRSYLRTLSKDQLPESYSIGLSLILAVAMGLAGICMSLYLIFSPYKPSGAGKNYSDSQAVADYQTV